ncbi:MAG: 5-formyltetrahydrofolate cyclo-ligase [Rickettsiaceae bacterium]|nr:5-formyltetrahydrofolate cyclo-ligase [Rickettsiaceae bacterium]
MPDKSSLRAYFLKLRAGIPEPKREDASFSAAKNFLSKFGVKNTDIVSAYYPINNEINPLPIVSALNKDSITTALPVIVAQNEPLIFREWQYQNELVSDSFLKLSEPPASAKEVIPTIMIVPLLAFDTKGNRLGYGGGFFDRTIHGLKNVRTVGLAYDCQKADFLPVTEYDEKLDYVITEKDVIKFTP